MSEVVRFRVARAPQRAAGPAENQMRLSAPEAINEWVAVGVDSREAARAYLAGRGMAPPARLFRDNDAPVAGMLELVRWLDTLLLEHDNRVNWARIADEFLQRFDGNPVAVTERAAWITLREQLSLALIAILLSRGDSALGGDVMRLLLVMGLVERVASQGPLGAAVVFAALRWRIVLLPPELLSIAWLQKSILARRPGVSDLYIVREEWNRYEVGEIAHIENVLRGEVKRSLLEKTDETETTVTTETETTKQDQRDTQTTDRFELKLESQTDTSLALHLDGKVDTSGQYGPTKVDSHLGATFDYSVQEATARATTQARETIARAVSSVQETVRSQRIARTLTRTRTLDRHALDNSRGDDHMTGIYRWVDKIQTVQIFKYPHRLLYEFEVPEPGAFIRWLNARPKIGLMRPLPAFTLDGNENGPALTADAISGLQNPAANEINYLTLARRYDVQGLPGPPTNKVVFAAITNDQPDFQGGNNLPPVYKTSNIAIPDGYEGARFTIFATATNGVSEDNPANPTGWLEIVIGTDFASQDANDADPQLIWRFQGRGNFRDMKSMNFRERVSGQVPIMLATDDTTGLMANVQVLCEPSEAAIREWRLKVFDLILGQYLTMQQQQAEAAAQAAVQAGIVISGDSATRNQEVIREEIKRCVIELLMGTRFNGRASMEIGVNGPDRIGFDTVRQNSQEIQFLEEAFEWENLSYVLYPYYWAGSEKWAELETIESADPEFDRFLRSGSARVVLPARPGFEGATQLYTTLGVIWGGGPAPAPDDVLYLSVADEIRAQQQAPADGVPGESWEVRLPTTLVFLSPLGTVLPLANANAQLPANG